MKYLTLIILFFCACKAWCNSIDVHINPGVDTSDAKIKMIIETWKNYLKYTDTLGKSYTAYWNKEEQTTFKNYDFLAYEFSQNWYKRGHQNIVSVQHIEDDLFKLRVQFYYKDSLSVTLASLINFYARKIGDRYYLENAFKHRTKDWQNKAVGHITYVYPKEHFFDVDLANKMNLFIDSIALVFDIKEVQPINFIFTDSWEQTQHAKGVDFYMGEGNYWKPQGRVNGFNNWLFSGRGSEWYPHEVIHLYLYPLYKNAAQLHEGIACFLGGHLGKDLSFHYKRLYAYLLKHPEIDLSNLFDFYYMDAETNPTHVISGLFTEIAYERGGIRLVKELLATGDDFADISYKERYFKIVEAVLQIKKENYNAVIMKELKKRVVD